MKIEVSEIIDDNGIKIITITKTLKTPQYQINASRSYNIRNKEKCNGYSNEYYHKKMENEEYRLIRNAKAKEAYHRRKNKSSENNNLKNIISENL
jgi:hypothetical protein